MEEKSELKHGELKDLVLAALGVSTFVGGIFVFGPNFPILVGSIIGLVNDFKKKPLPHHKIHRVLKNLEKKKIISLHQQGEEVYVEIKDGYNRQLIKHSIKRLLELKKEKKKWDGKWYLVMFDIPEDERNKRVYLRKFLRTVGFYRYQKSVYLFPYRCEEEIILIKKIIEGGKYMSYIVAERIEFEKQAKVYFGLN